MFSEREALWIDGKEVAHLHAEANGVVEVDLRVGRRRARELRGDGRVHHRSAASDWIEMKIASDADVADAVAIFRILAREHAPAAGRRAKAPPSEAVLRRRRKLHE